MTLHEAYHLLGVIFRLITIGTILKAAAWLYKRWQEKQENEVLDALRPQGRRWHWQSGYGVVARIKRDLVYKYSAALFPSRIEGWSSFVTWLRALPARVGYFYSRKFAMPNERKANKILRALWKRGLLVCPPENSSLYQLKY